MSNPDLDRQSILGGRSVQFSVSASAPLAQSTNSPQFPSSFSESLPHHNRPWHRELFDVGIFRDTILPSLSLHGSLAIIAYGIGRATDSVEAKDWLWPTAPLANAWWSAVGRKLQRGLTLQQSLSLLSRPERLLLTGVTLWGGRLLYRISSRSIARRRSGKGTDDPRYAEAKKEPGYWNSVLFSLFLPEAVIQTLITLPFTAPFHHQGGVFTGYHPLVQGIAVGLFSAGFALEVLADLQLEAYKKTADDQKAVCKEGVWSLVRHPK
jgi:steroid 5-alpha reductase family enzyme